MHKLATILISFIAVAATLSSCALCVRADSHVPQTINYQGRLRNADGSPVGNGTYSVTFSVYASATGGAALWTETQSSVQATGGIFHALLGSGTPIGASVFPSGADRWFGVTLGDDPELTPRQKIASVPFTLRADTVSPASIGATELADAAVGSTELASSAVTTDAIASVAVTGAKLADGSVASAKVADSAVGSAKLSSDASSLSKVSGGAMTASGGNIGVGTTSPAGQLTVRKATTGDALTVRNTGDTANTFGVTDAGSLSASAGAFTGALSSNLLTVGENSSAPSTPSSGKGTIYEDTSQNVFLLTSSGTKNFLNLNYAMASQSANVNSNSTTPVDITGTDVTLAAGTYLLFAHFWGRIWWTAGGSSWAYMYGQIYNVTDNAVIKDSQLVSLTCPDITNGLSFNLYTTLTISATKTLRLRGYTYSGYTYWASGFRNDSGGCADVCRLLAIRVSQ